MNPAAKRGSETNYTTDGSNICPCLVHMNVTASTDLKCQNSPLIKPASSIINLFKIHNMNMFKINLNPVLCISAFLLVAYCTLVPSTSSEKVSQLVLFLDRFLSIESEFK